MIGQQDPPLIGMGETIKSRASWGERLWGNWGGGGHSGRGQPGEGLKEVGQLALPPIGVGGQSGVGQPGEGLRGFGQPPCLQSGQKNLIKGRASCGRLAAVGIIVTSRSRHYGIPLAGFLCIQIVFQSIRLVFLSKTQISFH